MSLNKFALLLEAGFWIAASRLCVRRPERVPSLNICRQPYEQSDGEFELDLLSDLHRGVKKSGIQESRFSWRLNQKMLAWHPVRAAREDFPSGIGFWVCGLPQSPQEL